MLPSLQRKTAAQKSAQAVTNALNNHRIPHTPSLNPGMVTITSPGRPLVHLKLQKDLGTNHWRWMLDGSTEWLTCHSKTFLALFSCKKDWLANTTKTELLFGPYEGQTVAAHDLCTGIRPYLKSHHIQTGVGHYGVFSGRRWKNEIYPRVRELIHGAEG